MFVPCPHCGFLPALIVAQGAPRRCPRCQGALPAAGTPSAVSPPDPDPAATADDRHRAAGIDPPAQIDAVLDAEVEPDAGAAADPVAALLAINAAPAATPDAATAGAPAAMSRAAASAWRRRGGKPGTPSFARAAHATVPPGPHWPGLLVIAVLVLVLAAQLLLVQRAALAASAQWRPLITRVCATVGCALPPWHEPAAFTMLDRGVQPDPRRPGVLAVQASFRNDARWPQPWPTLLLSLADIDGSPVAHGAFAPAEYGAPDAPPLLAPGQAASVAFAVREPAPHGVAFSFQFR